MSAAKHTSVVLRLVCVKGGDAWKAGLRKSTLSVPHLSSKVHHGVDLLCVHHISQQVQTLDVSLDELQERLFSACPHCRQLLYVPLHTLGWHQP